MKFCRINPYLILAYLIMLGFQLYFWDFIIDDAFISFRYAKNLYQHNQLVFNINELPVEGYSNFLWVIWIYFGFILGFEPILFSKISGMIFTHICLYILYKLGLLLKKSKISSAIIVIFYTCLSNVALWSIGGLETSLFILLLLIAVYFFIANLIRTTSYYIIGASFFFSLASLTRHEATIVYAISIIFLIGIQIKKRDLFSYGGIIKVLLMVSSGGLIYMPYFIWRVNYYNSILPHTFLVKSTPITFVFLLEQFMFYLPLILIILPGIFLILVRIKKQKFFYHLDPKNIYLIMVISTFSFILFFLSSWMPGFRFAIPIIPLILLLIPDSLNFFYNLAKKFQDDIKLLSFGRYFTITTICISHLMLFFSFNSYVYIYSVGIDEINIKLGKWINQNTNQSASLAIWDVGAIPFYADIRTIDIYPESLQDKHVFQNPEDADYILEQNISLLILNDEYFDYIKSDSRFMTNYHLIFNAQLFYEENHLRIDYIYQVYLFNGYYISNTSITSLINSSPRFYI